MDGPLLVVSEDGWTLLSGGRDKHLGCGFWCSLRYDSNNNVDETLLRELADMGFKEIDLNKEILRLNEYNLEQSLDDLCGISEWDPILEELQEMGFPDRETNKMLVMKNEGSIKRIVMDLVAGEKTE